MIFFTIIAATKIKRTKLMSKNNIFFVPSCGAKTGRNAQKMSGLASQVNQPPKTAIPIAQTSKASKAQIFNYPKLNQKKTGFVFEVSKNSIENYTLKEPHSAKSVLPIKKLPIKKSTHQDTLKTLKISKQEDDNQKVLQDFKENPNRLIDDSENRSIFDLENEARILIDLDICKIELLPEHTLKDQAQNIKVFVGVTNDQFTDHRHVLIGKINEIFPDGSMEMFGCKMASGSIQINKHGKLEYLLESTNRILKDKSGLLQAVSVPQKMIIVPGWSIILKLSPNQNTVAETIALILLQQQNPGSVTHETNIQESLTKVKTQFDELDVKEKAIQAALTLMKTSPSNLFPGTQGGQGGQGGNLPPI